MQFNASSPVVTAPPPKKQRSDEDALRGRPPSVDPIDDALARRRLQLQDLRRQQQRTDLLTKARSQLRPGGPMPGQPVAGTPHTTQPPTTLRSSLRPSGIVPPQQPLPRADAPTPSPAAVPPPIPIGTGQRRESDIFPSVPKSPGLTAFKRTTQPRIQPIHETDPHPHAAPKLHVTTDPTPVGSASNPPPQVPALQTSTNPNLAASSNSSNNTPTSASPKIVRRLDFASNAPPAPSDTQPPTTSPEHISVTQTPTPALVAEDLPTPTNTPTNATTETQPLSSKTTSTSQIQSNHSNNSNNGGNSSGSNSHHRNRSEGGRPIRPPPITPMLDHHTNGHTGSTSSSTTSLMKHHPDDTHNTSAASRQAFLSSMHDAADSPSTASKRNSELELIRELKKVHQDKEDAFRQVVRLREQIQKLQQQDVHQDRTVQEFQNLVQIANRNGDRAALKWAREQAAMTSSSNTTTSSRGVVYPKSPLSSHSRTASPSRRAMSGAIIGPGVRKRVATPHPKRNNANTNGEESKLLAKATETNPDEFDSEVATYRVRKPYILDNDDFWNKAGCELSKEEYQASADVTKPASLDIAANIKADGSILLLSGVCNVRHKKPRSTKWRIFEDVDDMDKPLGSVMFIDEQANEGEYWLDEIYEEAMSTRDTYCSSLMATASALKSALMFQNSVAPPVVDTVVPVAEQNGINVRTDLQQPPMQLLTPTFQPPPTNQTSSPPMMHPPMQQPKSSLMQPPVQEASVMHPKDPTVSLQLQQQQHPPIPQDATGSARSHDLGNNLSVDATKSSEVKHKEVSKPEKKQVAPPPEDEEGASDVLSTVLGFFFVTIFQVVYFLVVKLPFRIAVTTVLASIIGAVLSIVWFYVANDNGAGEMGANLGYGYNRAGIY